MHNFIQVYENSEFETNHGKFGFFQFEAGQYVLFRIGDRNRFNSDIYGYGQKFDIDEFCEKYGHTLIHPIKKIKVNIDTNFVYKEVKFKFFQISETKFILYIEGQNNRYVNKVFNLNDEYTIEELIRADD